MDFSTLCSMLASLLGALIGAWLPNWYAQKLAKQAKLHSLYLKLFEELGVLGTFEDKYFKFLDQWDAVRYRMADASEEELTNLEESARIIGEDTADERVGMTIVECMMLEENEEILRLMQTILHLVLKYGEGIVFVQAVLQHPGLEKDFQPIAPDVPHLSNAATVLFDLVVRMNPKYKPLEGEALHDQLVKLSCPSSKV